LAEIEPDGIPIPPFKWNDERRAVIGEDGVTVGVVRGTPPEGPTEKQQAAMWRRYGRSHLLLAGECAERADACDRRAKRAGRVDGSADVRGMNV
jgi:hypothetical protein